MSLVFFGGVSLAQDDSSVFDKEDGTNVVDSLNSNDQQSSKTEENEENDQEGYKKGSICVYCKYCKVNLRIFQVLIYKIK